MKRSIIQKALLVCILVTVMGAGTLSDSEMGGANIQATQKDGTVVNGSNTLAPYYLTNRSSLDCPYHRTALHKSTTGYGRMIN